MAVKAFGPGLVHKTDLGAVALGLHGNDEVVAAAQAMTGQLTAAGQPPTGFIVQSMVSGGIEMIVGIVQDPSFGPMLACGAGGITAELLHDVSVRLTPLSEQDLTEMLRELKTYPLLTGLPWHTAERRVRAPRRVAAHERARRGSARGHRAGLQPGDGAGARGSCRRCAHPRGAGRGATPAWCPTLAETCSEGHQALTHMHPVTIVPPGSGHSTGGR